MTDRKITDGWPYFTCNAGGVLLPFKQLAMPGMRRNLKSALMLTQAEGLDLVKAANAPDATDEDRAQLPRAALLIEGAVGAYLMPLWFGDRTPTQDKVAADEHADPEALHFKGADHKEAAGLAFAEDVCGMYGVSFEHLVKCVAVLSNETASMAKEPDGKEAVEVTRFFGDRTEATT